MSFAQLLKEIRTRGNDGKAFEHFCKWFLENDPLWKTQVEQVWLWDEWPENWGRDKGIDLIFKHRNGQIWAVQAKCYDEAYNITKADVDKFLSESNRPVIHTRILMGTTNGLGTNAIEVMEGQEKPVKRYLLDDFEASALTFPNSLSDLSKPVEIKPPDRDREYQKKAVSDVIEKFKAHDRGQLIMACGTGKTFVTLWIKEEMAANTTLVLVPSLGLLSQTLFEWTKHCSSQFEVLCVCSDSTVGKEEREEDISISDASYAVTSDVGEIAAFLKKSANKVIFCTYQSSELVGQAQGENVIDLVVCDEAHRCAGRASAKFTRVLDDNFIKVKKRLFTTATPRFFAKNVSKAAEKRGEDLYGMDNYSIFGPVFFRYSFGQAIQDKWLTDYRVVVVGVDEPLIREYIENRELVKIGQGKFTDASSLASKIALAKASSDFNLTRIISFHSRVKAAKDFARDYSEIEPLVKPSFRPKGSLHTDFVSGEMSARIRRQKVNALRYLSNADRSLLANARCLSEGVDVPALDGVAFIDPKQSQVDIIQALGRALRLNANKTTGTIILPVFIDPDEMADDVIERTDYRAIWTVIQALRSHDETLADQIDEYRTQLARRKVRKRTKFPAKIIIDLPISIDESFQSALKTVVIEQSSQSWYFWYGLLLDFVEQNNAIPKQREVFDGHRLGDWVNGARYRKQLMTQEQIALLEDIPGWAWDMNEAAWNRGFAYLEAYVEEFGRADVTRDCVTEDGFNLGGWVSNQRNALNTNVRKLLTDEKIRKLEALPHWVWSLRDANWNKFIEELNKFYLLNGHTKVPQAYISSSGFKLGASCKMWRQNQRKLSDAKMSQLSQFPDWVWNLAEQKWFDDFEHLKKFVKKYGHANVPNPYVDETGFKLGAWVGRIRSRPHGKTPGQIAQLEALPGWVWNANEAAWELGMHHLNSYVKKHGDASVPSGGFITEDGYNLSSFVSRAMQAGKKGKLGKEKIDKLEALPGWVWDRNIQAQEIGITHLKEFIRDFGHARPITSYRSPDGYGLGSFVTRIRSSKSSLREEEIDFFEGLPGWAWNTREADWEYGLEKLVEYIELHNHARPPAKFVTKDGFRLGSWVTVNRQNREKMSADHKQRLEAVGCWVWSPNDADWEDGFANLIMFSKENGHANPSNSHIMPDGYGLGRWVNRQRQAYKNKLMSEERIQRLSAVDGWIWNNLEVKWEAAFESLRKFATTKGHARPANKHKTEAGFALGAWVGDQRRRHKKEQLEPNKIARLEGLPGWVWDAKNFD